MKHISFLLFLIVPILASAQKKDPNSYTDNFNIRECSFQTSGKNNYFILEPGFELVLRGCEGKDTLVLIITVSNELKKIDGVECRVVYEKELKNGKYTEISKNYFAFCTTTSSVFYFGEDVDIYKDGKVVSHDGSWLAGGDNKAGIQMPGQPLLGARYYQEIAPGIAMDRAEVISLSEKFTTPAGTFENCLQTEEGNALKPKEKEYKRYAPGIGLIQDENLTLISYGFTR